MSRDDRATVVVGLGKTGLSCVNYLTQQHRRCVVMDTRLEPPGIDQLRKQYPDVPCFLGELDKVELANAREIILSPGLPKHLPEIQYAAERNVPVVGDIELFVRAAKAPICAITGSNAKSTVTALVGAMAQSAKVDVRVGGNIGVPTLELLGDSEPALYVLELSSFQLETTESLTAFVATILNISPDHMDRYATYQDYVNAKHIIYHNAQHIVYNRDDEQTKPTDVSQQSHAITFGTSTPKQDFEFGLIEMGKEIYLAQGHERLLNVNELRIKGRHNWLNALSALALGRVCNLPMNAMLRALREFPGLTHRCQWVTEHNGVVWYNDSKGTNVGATVAAIEGLGQSISGKIILIAGGQGKGEKFLEMKTPVHEYVRKAILIGEDADKLVLALREETEIEMALDLQLACKHAQAAAKPGDAVLLSPACASFDMFKNFEHRGEEFMRIVKEITS